MRRPLLVIDGDSFAHRAYHALPKTIRRAGNKGAGAILGFANILLRLYEAESPRAVLVGWDTLKEPTYRHKALASYQSGRSFDAELIEQLEVLPNFVVACGFACAKAAGYEADDFLAAAAAHEEHRGGAVLVATGDRTLIGLHPRQRQFSSQSGRANSPGLVPQKCANVMASIPSRRRTSSLCAATPPTGYRGRKGSARKVRQAFYANTDRSKMHSQQDGFRWRLRNSVFIAPSRPWIDQRLCLRCRIKSPAGLRPLFSLALGSLSSWLSAWMRLNKRSRIFGERRNKMCRNIKTLHNFKPPATDGEIRASSLQFIRKLSGFSRPSKANEIAFNRAVDEVDRIVHELLDALVTNAPPRNREAEAMKARARGRVRSAA